MTKFLKPRTSNLIPSKGQSSLEVLIAITILTLAISAAIVVGFGNQSAVVDTELNNRALYLAVQELENLRAVARQDFSAVASSTKQEGNYTTEITVNTLGTYSKEVVAKLSWDLGPTQLRDLILSTIITDWRTAYEQEGTGDGGTGVTGDWTSPFTAGTFDLGPGNNGTDIAIRGDIIYMTGDAADDKKDDFYSIDVSDINDPKMLSSINTGEGLLSVAIWDTHAYAAAEIESATTTNQLQIIDISSSPSLIKKESLLNNTEDGTAVFAKDDYVYIGTGMSDSGAELHIYDASTPGSPVRVATLEIGDHVNDLYVFKDRLYVATSKIDKELIIYDVANPADPIQIGIYDHAGGTGKTVFVTSLGEAYLGVNDIFLILNTSDLGNIAITGSYDAGGTLNDLYIRDELAFLGTANNNSEFQVILIEEPTNTTLHSEFNFPQIATGITYRDNVVYVSVRSNDALRIITSTP